MALGLSTSEVAMPRCLGPLADADAVCAPKRLRASESPRRSRRSRNSDADVRKAVTRAARGRLHALLHLRLSRLSRSLGAELFRPQGEILEHVGGRHVR